MTILCRNINISALRRRTPIFHRDRSWRHTLPASVSLSQPFICYLIDLFHEASLIFISLPRAGMSFTLFNSLPIHLYYLNIIYRILRVALASRGYCLIRCALRYIIVLVSCVSPLPICWYASNAPPSLRGEITSAQLSCFQMQNISACGLKRLTIA